MAVLRTDYHMHTPLCQHAAGPLEAYVEKAIELGLEEIGFSDHNPLPNGLSARVRMTEDQLDYYVQTVRDLQFRYHGKINILLGLELDYVEGLESYMRDQVQRYPWDYVIGSIHHLEPSCLTMSWPRGYQGETSALYGRYFDLMDKLIGAGLCDIIAHFDVPKRSGRLPGEAELKRMGQVLDAIAAAGLSLEINTSGYRHAELVEPAPYPSLAIARQALQRGIPLMVNSDAHAPDHVGTRFESMGDWLRRNGCRSLARYHRRERRMCPLDG